MATMTDSLRYKFSKLPEFTQFKNPNATVTEVKVPTTDTSVFFFVLLCFLLNSAFFCVLADVVKSSEYGLNHFHDINFRTAFRNHHYIFNKRDLREREREREWLRVCKSVFQIVSHFKRFRLLFNNLAGSFGFWRRPYEKPSPKDKKRKRTKFW